MISIVPGTIRVYCRVRPFLSGQANGQSTVDYIGENGDVMIVNHHKHGKDARRVFNFNKVFGQDATQRMSFFVFHTILLNFASYILPWNFKIKILLV